MMPFDWSLLTQIVGFIGVIVVIVTASVKITRLFTKLEGLFKIDSKPTDRLEQINT